MEPKEFGQLARDGYEHQKLVINGSDVRFLLWYAGTFLEVFSNETIREAILAESKKPGNETILTALYVMKVQCDSDESTNDWFNRLNEFIHSSFGIGNLDDDNAELLGNLLKRDQVADED